MSMRAPEDLVAPVFITACAVISILTTLWLASGWGAYLVCVLNVAVIATAWWRAYYPRKYQ
jgi:hypothetical protein